MRIHFDPEHRSLYIELSDRASCETEIVVDGLNVDLDAEGRPVGIEIEDTDLIPGFRAALQP